MAEVTCLQVITYEDGSQLLITTLDDGVTRIAQRNKSWETWGPPHTVTIENRPVY